MRFLSFTKRHATLLVALLFFTPQAHASGGAKQKVAYELFKRAHAQTDLEAGGSPAFALDARITLYTAEGSETGSYQLAWASGTESRRETSLPDYHSLSVENGARVWHSSTLRYRPYLVYEVEQVVSFPSRLRLRPHEEAGRIKDRTIKRESVVCAQLRFKRARGHTEYCFDAVTGYLIRESDPLTTAELSDYAPAGAKTFPRTLRVLLNGHIIVEVDVTRLVLNPVWGNDPFGPLPGTRPTLGGSCHQEQIAPPHLVHEVNPQYPRVERQNLIEGDVSMYVEVGEDGLPRGLTILGSPGPDFSDASLAAVKQWRFRPATCRGNPIALDTFVQVHFTLRP